MLDTTTPSLANVGRMRDPMCWPPELVKKVDRFLFGAAQWVHPAALQDRLMSQSLGAESPPGLDGAPLAAQAIERLVARVAPVQDIRLGELTCSLPGRLALLDARDWLRLGLTVSSLPNCGRVHRSMDGHFRRTLREHLGPDAPALLDAQAGQGPELTFSPGPGAWRHADQMAAAGMRAALDQVCAWSEPVQQRFALQFAPAVWATPPSVDGLNRKWLEVACKLTLQDHPWLWS